MKQNDAQDDPIVCVLNLSVVIGSHFNQSMLGISIKTAR